MIFCLFACVFVCVSVYFINIVCRVVLRCLFACALIHTSCRSVSQVWEMDCPGPQMQDVGEMGCPGLEKDVSIDAMRERVMKFEKIEQVWNETMEHILKTMFATNAELAELQSTHKKDMQKHEKEAHAHEMEIAKMQVVLKERTQACRQARAACPLMLVKIDSLQSENARQASEIKELREDNESLSRLLEACQILDE